MKLDKKTLMPLAVLVSICVIVAALLGAINMLTAPEIEKNALKKEQEALFDVFSAEENGFDKVENLDGLPATVTAVYKAKGGEGFAVSLATTTSYSSGDMTFVVGVDNSGKVTGVKLTGYYESKDFGKETYPEGFVGKTEGDYEDIPVTSGVTYSSNAFKAAIGDAFTAIKLANGETVEPAPDPEAKPKPADFAREESEVISLAEELVGSSAGFKKLELSEAHENLLGMYKDRGGKGYAAYILVLSPDYGTPESEALVYIDNSGKIKDTKKLLWKTSDAIYGYNPPSQEEADAFYARLNGMNFSSVEGVLLVSDATKTSGRLISALKAALEAAEDFIAKDMPTPESELKAIICELAGKETELENVTPLDTEYLKRLYKDKNGNGYFAYIVALSPEYGTLESEAVLHIEESGKIKNTKKLLWKTSDAIYGYNPPSQEEADAFYARLNGAGSASVEGVLLVSNATNTSGRVISAVKEALLAVDALEINYAPRVIGIIAFAAMLISGVAVFIIFRKRRAPYEK